MKNYDLVGHVGRIQRATAQLKEHWTDAKQHWNDSASREFEEQYLAQLPPRITLLAAAIHKLGDILAQAEKDLEDRERE